MNQKLMEIRMAVTIWDAVYETITELPEFEDVSELASYDELMRYPKSITDSIVQMIGKHNPAKLSEFSRAEWLELSPIEFFLKFFSSCVSTLTPCN